MAAFCRAESPRSLLNEVGERRICSFQHKMYFAACLQAAPNPKGITGRVGNQIATGGREGIRGERKMENLLYNN